MEPTIITQRSTLVNESWIRVLFLKFCCVGGAWEWAVRGGNFRRFGLELALDLVHRKIGLRYSQ